MSEQIFHVAMLQDLEQSRRGGIYQTSSLATEGFIHCCTKAQLAGVLERYFSDNDDYEIIEIDTTRLLSDTCIVYENTVGGSEQFPHLYGAIPMAAIKRSSVYFTSR